MKRGEKGGEGQAEKQENLGEKLKRVGKRGGHATPVVPFWRLQLQLQQQQQLPLLAATTTGTHHSGGGGVPEAEAAQDSIFEVAPVEFPSVSARKLAATFWELHHYKLPISKMHQGVGGHPPRLRRLHHRHNHLYEDKDGLEHPDPSPSSPDLPGSASSLQRHVASLMQHHRPIDRSSHAMQPVSPASYGSSLEMKSQQKSAKRTIQRRGFSPQQNKLKNSDDAAVLVKLEASKRKLQERYQEAQNAKRQ